MFFDWFLAILILLGVILFVVFCHYISERIRARAWRKEFKPSDTDRQH